MTRENLIIRADANRKIGTGHLMRTLALAQAWQAAGGEVILITACSNDNLIKIIRENKIEICSLANPYPDFDDWIVTRDVLSIHPNSWVVLDGYHFDEVYQERIKSVGNSLLVMDDTCSLSHYYADIVLNQNLHAKNLKYTGEPYTRLLLGTDYALLRKEFIVWKDWKRKIEKTGKRVLVTLGGSDPDNYTLEVIRALQKVDVSGLETIIVIGASNPFTDVLESAAKESCFPIRLIYNARNMAELMAWADVAISNAGSTVWELMFMSLPSLLIASADNQEPIAKSVNEIGGAIRIAHCPKMLTGKVEQFTAEIDGPSEPVRGWLSLERALANLLGDKSLRLEMSKKGRELVDGNGTRRIILEMSKEMLL